jgi:flagellar P-ring protein FlgI
MRLTLILIVIAALAAPLPAVGVRLKDIAAFSGVRDNQLFGYGVVVGLEGTGDSTQNKFTFQTIANYLERMGLTIQPKEFQMRNTAAVAVTATLPPFARTGSRIDVTVSSMGSAKSIQGGVLMITPLMGPDGQVYAAAQGSISIGGFNATQGGGGVSKNHATVGRIMGGALIEKEVGFDFLSQNSFTLIMNQDDFTTTERAAAAINKQFGTIASALDSRTIRIIIPAPYQQQKVRLASLLESMTVDTDSRARIVVNERTGTIVFGENVRIDKVALAHGGITVTIRPETFVSQPAPLAPGGQTVVQDQPQVGIEEEKARVATLEPTTSIGDVVKALNLIGATPRDIIAILQAIKSAGALQCDLEIL